MKFLLNSKKIKKRPQKQFYCICHWIFEVVPLSEKVEQIEAIFLLIIEQITVETDVVIRQGTNPIKQIYFFLKFYNDKFARL